VLRQFYGCDERPVAWIGHAQRRPVQGCGERDESIAGVIGLLLAEVPTIEAHCECVRGRDELINDCTRPAPSPRLGIAVAAQELRQLAKKLERTVFVGEHQLCHHAVIITAAEMRLQPGLVALLKGEVRFGRIDDFRAGVHIGFGGIGLDQFLREAVNGRAGELIDGVARALHLRLLLGGDPGAKGKRQLAWHFAARKRLGEARDPLQELACGKFGEGHRRDVLGLDAICEQHRDPPRHQRRLAGACPRLHQQGTIDRGQRRTTRRRIGKRFHAASHISTAFPSRSRAGSRLRST
jgi:hypothetical protein